MYSYLLVFECSTVARERVCGRPPAEEDRDSRTAWYRVLVLRNGS